MEFGKLIRNAQKLDILLAWLGIFHGLWSINSKCGKSV